MAKAKPVPEMDLNDLLDGASISGPKKKGTDVPAMEITDPKVQERMATWAQANKDVDTAEAVKAAAEADLIPIAQAFHLTAVEARKLVPAAIKLNSPTVNMIIDVAKNQYGKIALEVEEQLTEVFGTNFGKCFVKATEIKLTDEALADKEILIKLIKAVGEENFEKYFEVKRNFKPTEFLHQGRFMDKEVRPCAEKAIEMGLLAPYKPSFKAKA